MNQTTAYNSAVLPSNHAAETYSNDLMDDLFADVDQILGGDLSTCMTVVGRQPTPIRTASSTPTQPARYGSSYASPTSRTVQLPPNLSETSSAASRITDRYQTHVGRSQSRSSAVGLSHVGPSVGDRSYALSVRTTAPTARKTYRTVRKNQGFGGGRPVTAPRKTAAQAGNLTSAVIQTANQLSPNIYGEPNEYIQPVSSSLYSKTAQQRRDFKHRDFTFASPRPPQMIFEPEAPQQVSLPFLLMGAASISAVSTVGLWALSQNAPSTGWLLSLNREAAAAEISENSTEDFLAYLQRSLDVINARQINNGQTMAVIPVAHRTSSVPTTVPNTNPAPQSSVLPNLPGAAAPTAPSPISQPNVIERVFVPVYQNAQAPTTPIPSVAVPRTNAQLPKVPVPAPVAAAAAIPPGAPAAATSSVPVVPVGASALPTPTTPVPIAISPANAAAITDTTPTSEHVLVGVLNLGSRSAALFNIEGTSQRAYVGDRIGVSDWTLVSINGQDVQVRRKGEVRSIYIGQRF
ncbi:MAG: hypothetical protein AAF703_13885 [Cyanobacteria bacterium P01_D01_bin.105]